MTGRTPPAHLIRPILYPTYGKHPGMGADARTVQEIAAINDELAVVKNQEELAESYRVAGVTPEGLAVTTEGEVLETSAPVDE